MFKERHSLNVGECPWSRRIFSKSETRWRFNGTTIPNRTSHSSFFVARVLAPVAAANRMCSVTSHDPKLAIPATVFSSSAWILLAVTLCNRGGAMATIPAFIVLTICAAYLRARRRNKIVATKQVTRFTRVAHGRLRSTCLAKKRTIARPTIRT